MSTVAIVVIVVILLTLGTIPTLFRASKRGGGPLEFMERTKRELAEHYPEEYQAMLRDDLFCRHRFGEDSRNAVFSVREYTPKKYARDVLRLWREHQAAKQAGGQENAI